MPWPSRPIVVRLFGNVDVDPQTGCWPWKLHCNRDGYPVVWFDGKNRLAHRVSYELLVGPVPEGLQLDHVRDRGCIHRHCINPDHLEPVTGRENVLRGDTLASRQAAQTHCVHGHLLDKANTYVTRRGQRQCRICLRRRKLEWAERKAQK